MKRPDGAEQVTLDGAPLYAFAEDSPGQVTGDGVQDSFGGKAFTWHVIAAGAGTQHDQSTTGGSSAGGWTATEAGSVDGAAAEPLRN